MCRDSTLGAVSHSLLHPAKTLSVAPQLHVGRGKLRKKIRKGNLSFCVTRLHLRNSSSGGQNGVEANFRKNEWRVEDRLLPQVHCEGWGQLRIDGGSSCVTFTGHLTSLGFISIGV